MLYQSLVDPNFRFCCSVWGKFEVTTHLILEKLQNRVVRIKTDSSNDAPAKALLNQLRLPSIAGMIHQEFANMFTKQ